MGALAFDNSIFTATNGQPDALLAQLYFLSATGSLKLPKDQWHKEVKGWFEIVLARYQLVQTVFTNIPVDLIKESHIDFVPASNQSKALEQQCSQQRVTAPQRYQSYNLFALVIIFFFGIVVPVTALVLRTTHAKLFKINPKGHRFLSYQGEGLMQLHRMALEGSGYHGWEGGLRETPRTAKAEQRIPQVIFDGENDDKEPMLRYPRLGYVGQVANGYSTKQGYDEVSKEVSEPVVR